MTIVPRPPQLRLVLLGSLSVWLLQNAAPAVDFNREVRPILSEKCYHCHGADEHSRKAKLRLDSREEAIRDRKGVRAIDPAALKDSELILRILSEDPDEMMPPPKEHKALTKPEIGILKNWVLQGAEYAPHWAFTAPKPVSIPAGTPGKPLMPIDAFIGEQLKAAGLAPSPQADRATLIRRLSLDLTGLAPTPEESAAFVGDLSADYYERAVDRLLNAPAYGERWAKMWLDLARYADSTGYGQDSLRPNIWPWRDWVIKAFNTNMPYDRFTLEQLAGDLLPGATQSQILATAFHRNTMTNTEGGTDDEEYRVAAIKDRVATTGQVWMGLTVGCAQCHTHKFDPISHKEYYQWFAIFNQTQDADRRDEAPVMAVETAAETEQRNRLKSEISALEAKATALSPEFKTELSAWENDVRVRGRWTVLNALEASASDGVKLLAQPDGSWRSGGNSPETTTYKLLVPGPLKGVTAVRLEALTDPSLPNGGPGRAKLGNAVVSELRLATSAAGIGPARARFVRVELPGPKRMLALAEVQVFSGGRNIAPQGSATQSSTGFDGRAALAIDDNTEGHYFNGKSVTHTALGDNPWWEVDLGAEQPVEKLVLWNRTDTHSEWLIGAKVIALDANRHTLFENEVITTPEPSVEFDPRSGISVALRNASADFSQMGWQPEMALDINTQTGWAFAPEGGKSHALVVETARPLDVEAGGVLRLEILQNYPNHSLGRFRLSVTAQPPPVRELPAAIQALLNKAPAARSAAEWEELAVHFRPLSKVVADLRRQIEAKTKALAAVKNPGVPVMRELDAAKHRKSFIFNKGNFLTPGEPVTAGLPAAFHAVPAGPIDRLKMAEWLISPQNPLTARVSVNRFWAQIFGTGLVESEEDFGTQGRLPSHPELLDWLAREFIQPAQPGATPWDVKRLLRTIVMSETYRQSSVASAEAQQKDPRNRLLSHAPRRRLDGEAVRDQALELAGLLTAKLGGPSVYPPQPNGIWRVAFNGGENAYPTSTGPDRWRRSLYTFWRRTSPNPTQAIFDAPSRETCTLRRVPTNTPLQAFVTLNDPVFVECAQGLARRILAQGGPSTDSRLRFGLQLCTGRPPAAAGIATLKALYESEFSHFQAVPAEAAKLAASSELPLPQAANPVELAAWTAVANVLLNLDSVLTNH